MATPVHSPNYSVLSAWAAEAISPLIRNKPPLIIVGGMASGKSTLCKALSDLLKNDPAYVWNKVNRPDMLSHSWRLKPVIVDSVQPLNPEDQEFLFGLGVSGSNLLTGKFVSDIESKHVVSNPVPVVLTGLSDYFNTEGHRNYLIHLPYIPRAVRSKTAIENIKEELRHIFEV